MDLTLETDILRAINSVHVSVMCETAFRYPGVSVCCSTIHRTTFFTSADLNPALGSAVLLNFQKQTIGGKIWLEPSDGSHFFQRQNPDLTKQLTMIETCAGIGAMITTPIFANGSAPRQMFR